MSIRQLDLDRAHFVGAASLVSMVGDGTKAAVFVEAQLLDGAALRYALAATPLMVVDAGRGGASIRRSANAGHTMPLLDRDGRLLGSARYPRRLICAFSCDCSNACREVQASTASCSGRQERSSATSDLSSFLSMRAAWAVRTGRCSRTHLRVAPPRGWPSARRSERAGGERCRSAHTSCTRSAGPPAT